MNFTKDLAPSISSTNNRSTDIQKRSSIKRLQSNCRRLLAKADVTIDGPNPWDMRVHNPNLYSRIFADGPLGLGESYVDGWWDCEALDEFFFRVLRADLDTRVDNWKDAYASLKAKIFNLQKVSKAIKDGQQHYDKCNDLNRHMLDKRMIYSCGYWHNVTTLEQAQEAKLDLICRKLELQPGMRLLDIGCGWGGFAAYAAEKYGVKVVGVTVSRKQAEYAREHCRGLPVTIKLQDYREVEGIFDRIVSVGMFEHVGHKNYRTFIECTRKLLCPDGLALLHTIGSNRTVTTINKWTSRYIFPNSMLPSAVQIAAALEGLFVIEDWHSFGIYYDTTLMHWFRNFDRAWKDLQGGRYDQRFYRIWKYYLLSCAGAFRARKNQLWQLVLSPMGCVSGYCALR